MQLASTLVMLAQGLGFRVWVQARLVTLAWVILLAQGALSAPRIVRSQIVAAHSALPQGSDSTVRLLLL